jgi:hypothetical protein
MNESQHYPVGFDFYTRMLLTSTYGIIPSHANLNTYDYSYTSLSTDEEDKIVFI